MRQDAILRRAKFDDKVINYWMVSTVIICVFSIVGVVVLPILLIVLRPILRRYLDRISCELTERSLILRKGWLNRVEKTIPLDKITDLAMFQGPIMRAMNLQGFRVETAGSGGAATGYLVSMVGIIDTMEFRDAVLSQKDAVESVGRTAPLPTPTPSASNETGSDQAYLREIRDILARIETCLLSDRKPHD